MYLVHSLKCRLSLIFVTVTELITVHFGETNQSYILCSLFFLFNIVIKIATVLILLLQVVIVETANQCEREKESICCLEVDVVKNKHLEDVTEE